MLHSTSLFCCLIGLAFPLFSSAQPEPAVFTRIYGDPFGIPEININDMLQDRDGFFWLATRKGLIRYDGYEMKVYWHHPGDTNSIGSNRLRALAEDEEGFLWLGTTNDGLSRYDKGKEVFTNFFHDPQDSNSLSANEVTDLFIDHQDRLWVGTSNGLDRVDRRTGDIVHYRIRPNDGNMLSGNHINCLQEDNQGRIWVGTQSQGLYCLDPETGEVIRFLHDLKTPAGLSNNRIIRMAIDANGYIWAATGDAHLNRIDPATFEIRSYSIYSEDYSNEEMANVRPIVPDAHGGLWLGTWGNGLLYFSPETSTTLQFKHDPSSTATIASDIINALWMDKNKHLWIAHMGPGLSRLATEASRFEALPLLFNVDQEFTYPSFQCVTEDSQGKVWMGTHGNGLFRYHPATGETSIFKFRKDDPKSLAHNIVWDILEDGEGAIWVATHKGLQRLNPDGKTFTTFLPETGSDELQVSSLLQDHSGRIWVGTFQGLYWLDRQTSQIRAAAHIPKVPDVWIRTMYEDSQKNLWLAAFNHGLYKFNITTGDGVFFQKERYQPASLSNNSVAAIAEDSKGRIWLGTEGGGLNLFLPHPTDPDSSSFRHWRPYNSALPDENIFSITLDRNDLLWLSTDLGLFSFDPETQRVKAYSLPGTIRGLNARARPGLQGTIYVANAQHTYRFHPDSIRNNKLEPPVFLTDLQINGRSVPVRHTLADSLTEPSPLSRSILYTSSFSLKHWQNNLTLNFAALDYVQPEDNRYRYLLEGYDEEWMETDAANRNIRYTNLSPGDYTFRVIASNNDGLWNRIGKAITFHIHPPWWRTWWATLLYILLGLALLAAIRQYELGRRLARAEAQKQEEINQLQTRLYTNITHEFRTPLTIMLGMTDQLKGQVSEHAKEGLQLIKRNSRQLLRLVNQMLDLSKLEAGGLQLNYEQGDIINYLQYLVESFRSYAESKQIRLHFLNDIPSLYMYYDPVRLMHVLSNLLSNAIKFSPEGKNVYISLSLTDSPISPSRRLHIKVKDTGIGIPKEKLSYIFDRFYQADDSVTRKGEGTGIGLTLTRELVHLMNGEINVESSLGNGSIFTVSLPVSHSHGKRTTLPGKAWFPDPVSTPPLELATAPIDKKAEKPVVLIVEDNTDMVRYLVNVFNPEYQLEVAYNGQQGVDKARALIPDLVITDVMMPEKDGFALCQELKNQELTSHIPVIMLTARVDVESRLTGLKRGADAYLAKPFVQEELDIRIKALLERRRKLQAYFRRRAGISEEPETLIPPESDTAPENEFLSRVNQILEANLSNSQFSVDQLSKELFVHSSNLYRKLHALTGESPNQYIRSLRLAKAKQLLTNPSLTITTIAFETGFNSPEYFARIFKREMGMTPSEYRKGGRKEKKS